MSAAEVILPQVWAMAEAAGEAAAVSQRKGPHSLRLVAREADTFPRSVRNPAPHFAFYRKYTEAMLAQYMKLSMEAGRVPSLMGREMFQGNVSHTKVTGFFDIVHFCHDLGNCLKTLSFGQQHLIRRISMEGYTLVETSAMLGISLSTVNRRYAGALDKLTAVLIERDLLVMVTDLTEVNPQT